MREIKKYSLRKSAVLVSALALVIAACGGGDTGGTTAPAAPAAPAAPGAPTDSGPQRGGTLTIAFQRDVLQLDASVLTTEPTPVRLAIFETLFALDAGNIPQPALATSAAVSSDGLTWTFQLRPGVKFHNGQDFTSADVVASYARFLNVGRMAPLFKNNGSAEFVATGPLTVEARLTEPYGAFLEAVAAMSGSFIMLPAAIATANVENKDLTIAEIVGTGPYKVKEFIPDNRTVLERFDDYVKHEGEASYLAGPREAYFDEIVVLHIPDNGARVAALLAGEVDMIFPLPADDTVRVDADPNVEYTVTTPGARVYVKFNPTKAPFNDPLIREAVRTAIDPEQMIIGFGDPKFLNNDFTPRYQEGQGLWVDQSKYYPNDLEAGKALMARSTYAGETVILLTGSDRVDFPMSITLQQTLQKLGMKVEMRVVDGATFGAVRRDITAWDIKPSGGGSLVGVTYLDSSGIDRNNNPWPGVPDSWYAALDAVKNTSTLEERKAAASVVYDIHAEMNYEMWIASAYLIGAHKSDLRNVPPMDTLPFWNIWRAS